jgi:hypothetical protein
MLGFVLAIAVGSASERRCRHDLQYGLHRVGSEDRDPTSIRLKAGDGPVTRADVARRAG